MNDDASEKLKFNIPKNENKIKWKNTVLFDFPVNFSVESIDNWGYLQMQIVAPPPKKKIKKSSIDIIAGNNKNNNN